MKVILENLKSIPKQIRISEPPSEAYELRSRIEALKSNLKSTDYKAIKYAEGELSAEEYAETREQRRAWRAEINALEEELAALRNS